MNLGTALLALAFLALTSSTLILSRAYLADDEHYLGYTTPLVGIGATLLVSALVQLTYQFVVTDYSNAYVWQNTADYLPILYRITGVYAANKGSVLLWATIVAIVALVAIAARGVPDRHTRLVYALTTGVVAYFTAMLLFDSPFAPTRGEFPNAPPGFVPASGQGLNALLVDPYMAIHPPVMFTAYALLTMPFAIGAAHFVSILRGDGGLFAAWQGTLTRWLRLGWLFLTGAVALGGFWSYTVLGWGGIWAWDPVETAILIPWLFLTGTLHAVTNYRPGKRYTILAPAMTATVFALAIYTTTIVRSGVFRSVHSFADGGIGIAFLLLMAVTAILGVGLPLGYWAWKNDDAGLTDGKLLTRSNLLHLAVLLFGLLTFVSLWGLSFPVLRNAITGLEVAVEPRYYNLWSYPLVLSVLLLLGFYMDFDVEGRRRSLVGLGVFAAATLLAAFIAPSATWQLSNPRPTDAFVYRIIGSASVLSVLPPVAYVILAMLKRGLVRIPAAVTRNAKLKESGIMLIHVAAALLVLSLPFMYLFGGQASVMAATGQGNIDSSTQQVPGSEYSIRVLNNTTNEFPQDPDLSDYALTAEQVTARGDTLNGSVQTLYGNVTAVRNGPQATVAQLDGSPIWVGLVDRNGTNVSIQPGQSIAARGQLLWGFVPQTDAVLLTGPQTIGPAADPPESVEPTRVIARGTAVAVYEDGDLLTSGVVGQREYVRQGGLQVRDVLIDRGLVSDTYVIAGVSDGTASITIKRIPMMTLLRVSLVLLLLGMGLVLVFDPRHGLVKWTTAARSQSSTDMETTD